MVRASFMGLVPSFQRCEANGPADGFKLIRQQPDRLAIQLDQCCAILVQSDPFGDAAIRQNHLASGFKPLHPKIMKWAEAVILPAVHPDEKMPADGFDQACT